MIEFEQLVKKPKIYDWNTANEKANSTSHCCHSNVHIQHDISKSCSGLFQVTFGKRQYVLTRQRPPLMHCCCFFKYIKAAQQEDVTSTLLLLTNRIYILSVMANNHQSAALSSI